jgi:rRNA-processing protein FCF1
MPSALITLPINPVIDSNVLLDFLAWRFCVETKTPFPERMPDTSAENDTMRALDWYLDKAKPIHTSPHVIAEIHGLVQARFGWHGLRLSAFWRFAQEELTRLMLDEHLIKLVKMRPEDLAEFGPTDDSILELAAQTGGAVVTGEGDLRGRLTKDQIRVLDRYEILAVWQGRDI